MSVARAALIVALLGITSTASAAAKRRHFEPDDLELDAAGTLDIDLQVGLLHADAEPRNRAILPDFELGLGLSPNVQLEVDGAFSLDEYDAAHRHLSGEPLWIATKLGLFDEQDGQGNVWALGLELGPRLPTIDTAGVGYGAVALFGFSRRRLQLVLNAGAIIDPGATLSAARSESVILGLDLNADLDQKQRWSLQSELGGAYYFSSDPHELAFTLGATCAVSQKLDLSATALLGLLSGTDRAGVLLGVSPQIDLW